MAASDHQHGFPRWYLLGAGAMGSLATHYLLQAGFTVAALPDRRQPVEHRAETVHRQLHFYDGREASLTLPVTVPRRLTNVLVATKAGATVAALRPWVDCIDANTTVVCLQNGAGQLASLSLPCRFIYAITRSGAHRQGEKIQVVAENTTDMGDGDVRPPRWWSRLASHWPQLMWQQDIIRIRHQKLAVNAVINPLTAIYRCRNGDLLLPQHIDELRALSTEVDRVFAALDSSWPNDTFVRVQRVAKLTADNVSSMLADTQAGRKTEIDFINGWLVAEAQKRGIDAVLNRRLMKTLSA